jgi:hypothetical protein
LWTRIDEDGMMRLLAKLSAEDGAVVMAALESITGSKPVPDESASGVSDPADDRWAARRADALVAMSNHVLARRPDELVVSGATRQLVVHVDLGVLTGESPDGRCYIEGGAPLSAAAAQRLGCDAEVIAVTERDGLPIDVGRKNRFPTERLRRALEIRDRFCRFPGCGVPAHRTEAHHIHYWPQGGPTDRDNLVLLCSFHHQRHHGGGYVIRKVPGGFSFETHDGHEIGRRLLVVPQEQPSFPYETARSEWGGAELDFDHLMCILPHNMELAEARAAPPNSS